MKRKTRFNRNHVAFLIQKAEKDGVAFGSSVSIERTHKDFQHLLTTPYARLGDYGSYHRDGFDKILGDTWMRGVEKGRNIRVKELKLVCEDLKH